MEATSRFEPVFGYYAKPKKVEVLSVNSINFKKQVEEEGLTIISFYNMEELTIYETYHQVHIETIYFLSDDPYELYVVKEDITKW